MKLNLSKLLIITLFFSFEYMFSQTEILNKIKCEKIEIVNKKDTITILKTNFNRKVPKPTIIFLQGSRPLPPIYQYKEYFFSFLPFDYQKYSADFNIIIILRKGVPIVGKYPEDSEGIMNLDENPLSEYTKYNNLKYRTNQAKTVLNYLYKQKWVKKDSLYVIGHSEGFRVAAKLANGNKRIAKLICMSADPFNRLTEEIIRERVASFSNNNDSLSQRKIEIAIQNYKNIGNNIEKYKNDYRLYNWMSYEHDIAYKNFKYYKNPILIIYGTDDIPATHNDLIPFILNQKNIEIKAFPNYDHNYYKKEFDNEGKPLEDSPHWDEVFEYCIKWISKK